jgi:hypothetical protein
MEKLDVSLLMLEKIPPPDGSGDKVERNEEDDQDEKFQVDIGQISQNLLPINTAEEEKEKNSGQKKDDPHPDDILLHNKPSIIPSEIYQVNVTTSKQNFFFLDICG